MALREVVSRLEMLERLPTMEPAEVMTLLGRRTRVIPADDITPALADLRLAIESYLLRTEGTL